MNVRLLVAIIRFQEKMIELGFEYAIVKIEDGRLRIVAPLYSQNGLERFLWENRGSHIVLSQTEQFEMVSESPFLRHGTICLN